MPKPATKLPELSAWKTEMLRLTAFHQLGPQLDDHGWWETVVGTAPESKSVKPREGGFEVSGPLGTGVLALRANPFRYDWLYTAAISLDKPPGEFPTIGLLPETLTVFVPLMVAWFATAPQTHRLAFGTAVLQPVEDRVTGYKLLDGYLPSISIDPENSSEFSYSINRHRKAHDFDDIHVNRISRWSVIRLQPMMINMTILSGQRGTTDAVQGQALEALRLELDMNTAAERTQLLPTNQLPALFTYLVNLGKEIIEKGDIK